MHTQGTAEGAWCLRGVRGRYGGRRPPPRLGMRPNMHCGEPRFQARKRMLYSRDTLTKWVCTV